MTNHSFQQLQITHSPDASAKAKGFLKKIQNASFLKDVAMATDICTRLKKLSLFLQKGDCNIADCQGVIQSTIDGLDKLKAK
jgi:hypothetical protein